ncbi:cadherin-AgCad1-like [Hetaerina americana]|uniref:cadherin-AgCad1-like n=1 Tax=Hetaerina americana TaxID=62018 RepID=UPI003A7F5295
MTHTNDVVLIDFLEEAATPFPVLMVPGHGDNKPTYTITTTGIDQSILSFAQVKDDWILSVTTRQDYETNKANVFLVSVTMQGFDTTRVIMNVTNIDDNPPFLKSESTICTIEENRVGTTKCMITGSDNDNSFDHWIVEVLESGSPSNIFHLTNPEEISGQYIQNITVTQPLDYEKKNIYSLDVKALDRNFSTILSIIVKVTDIPDEPPVWSSWSPMYTIPEENRFSVPLKAYDGDVKINGSIFYKLEHSNTSADYFSIDENTGYLHVSEIDRDIPGNDEFQFSVMAYEISPQSIHYPSETAVQITFRIEDIDDNKPKFNVHTINHTMDEGSSILDLREISVTDPDLSMNGTFNVALKNKESQGTNYISAFTISPHQGYQNSNFNLLVVNPKLLDYENETWREFTIMLFAQEVADPSHTDHLQIQISLQNINDESPKFIGQYNANVPEDVEKGYLITTLLATDPDGPNDTISYFTTNIGTIIVDKNTGEVKTASSNSFDFESQREVVFQVMASDSADHRVYTELKVSVIDVNDVAPTLLMSTARVNVLENTGIGESVPGIKISARDPDTNANLSFSIDWDTSLATSNGILVDENIFINTFEIAPGSSCESASACADLRVKEKLHWNLFDIVALNITVTDKNTSLNFLDAAAASATLTVSIKDFNDLWPVINPIPPLTVPENSKEGQTIGNVVAKDDDFNQTLKYYLVPRDDTPADWVMITENKGVLYVGASNIDREAFGMLNYTVIVNDGPHNSTKEFSIAVEDLNDIAPVINNKTAMTASILENSPNGTYIFTIDATDGDSTYPFNEVSYIMDDLYPNQFFAININNGMITVSLQTEAVLDREKSDTYEIHISVRDNYNDSSNYNSHSTPAYITLTLLDENDNAPQFNEEPNGCQGNREFPETMGKGDTLFTITATDKDEKNTPNSEIDFKIVDIEPLGNAKNPNNESEELFTIFTSAIGTNYQGVVQPGRSLHSYFGKYNITIEATDLNTTSPQVNSETYTVCIEDINDSKPKIVFPKPNSAFQIVESQEPNEDIILYNNKTLDLFYATDDDGGLNGEVMFDIVGTEKIASVSLVESFLTSSGSPLTLGSFHGRFASRSYTSNHHQGVWYEVMINASDKGILPNIVSTNITIFVLSNKPHDPYFKEKELTVHFPENLKTEFNFTSADDVDDLYKPPEEYDPIYYFIVDGNKDLFALDKSSTTVRIVQGMDYETKHSYTIYVKATNSDSEPGTPNLSGNDILKITVNVDDRNDVPPKFTQQLYVGGIAPEDFIDSELFQVTAKDPDTKDLVTYTLMEETMHVNGTLPDDLKSSYSLDSSSGKLTIQFQPQLTMTGYATFKIKATDKANHSDLVAAQVYAINANNREVFIFTNTKKFVQDNQVLILISFSQAEVGQNASQLPCFFVLKHNL